MSPPIFEAQVFTNFCACAMIESIKVIHKNEK